MRSHQRKLSIRFAEDGNRCNDKAGFRQYTFSTVKNSNWTQLGKKVHNSLCPGKNCVGSRLKKCLESEAAHKKGVFCTGVSLGADTLSDVFGAGGTWSHYPVRCTSSAQVSRFYCLG